MDRMDQLPLPNLQLYSVFSGLAVFYAVVYALTAAGSFTSTLVNDVWCTAALLNFGCCCFVHIVIAINMFVIGTLHPTEKRHMRDKFWNFIFYKFIFVFGVINVQEVREMLNWSVWFAVVGCLLLTAQLCRDRFQYLSFSPNTPASSHAKIIILLSAVLFSCAGLFMICAIVGWQLGFNHFAFLYSEVFIIFARTLLTVVRYIIHLWDMRQDGLWENRNTYTYYAELVLELAALSVEFLHHVHMLLWANMFLSMASLILLMKLRFLYQEIQRRMKRHRNYVMVNQTLQESFQLLDAEQLRHGEEVCAICWEKMTSARRLPCGHAFHFGCLQSWLERDSVCPTCRCSLNNTLHSADDDTRDEEETEGNGGDGQRDNRNARRRRNWLLRFNGASIASWLPTFSLELHQHEDAGWITSPTDLNRGVEQIHNMFPHIPTHAISVDLTNTHSVSLTVENILNGSIHNPIPPAVPIHPPATNVQSNEATPTLPSSQQSEDREGSDDKENRLRHRQMTQQRMEREEERPSFSVGREKRESDKKYDFLSLQERKQRLLSDARRRYVDRHRQFSSSSNS